MAADAMRTGKDVYFEETMVYSIGEARRLAGAARTASCKWGAGIFPMPGDTRRKN